MRVCQRQRRHLCESLREWLLVPPFTRAFLKSPSSRGLSAIAELLVFGSSIPEKICNKNMHVYPPHLFTVLIPYLVKIIIHSPVFTLCFKYSHFAVCNKFAKCHPNLIIFSRHITRKTVTRLLRHSGHRTWLYMLQLYLVKQATVRERAKHEVLAKS